MRSAAEDLMELNKSGVTFRGVTFPARSSCVDGTAMPAAFRSCLPPSPPGVDTHSSLLQWLGVYSQMEAEVHLITGTRTAERFCNRALDDGFSKTTSVE